MGSRKEGFRVIGARHGVKMTRKSGPSKGAADKLAGATRRRTRKPCSADQKRQIMRVVDASHLPTRQTLKGLAPRPQL